MGPAAIGLIAHVSNLPLALAVLIPLLLAVAYSGRYLRQ